MLCDKCQKNQAVAHIKTVINGITYEKHLCEQCAKTEKMNEQFENPFSHFFNNFFNESPVRIGNETKKCPGCNSTIAQILNSGKIGCSECYSFFEDELAPYIKRLQGSSNHIGKTVEYDNTKEEANKSAETMIEKLQEDLKNAVLEERFEDAAAIRDKINEMKEEK